MIPHETEIAHKETSDSSQYGNRQGEAQVTLRQEIYCICKTLIPVQHQYIEYQ